MRLEIYFFIFESMIMLLFGFSLRHALKNSPAHVFQLLAGVLFGIFLEMATIQQLHAYRYGKFLFMVGNVPLVIGISWGIILYSVRLTSDKTNLPWMIRPFLDGLLALNIDFAMDALAIRLGMWNWGLNLQYQYFGVPYANFWAWFWVAFSFSSGIRLLTHWLDKTPEHRSKTVKTDLFIALGGLFTGLAGVLSTNAFIVYVIPAGLRDYLIAATLISVFIITVCFKPRFLSSPYDPIAFWVPFCFHVYFLTVGIITRIIFNPMFLLWMSLAMLILSFYWHNTKLHRISFTLAKRDL